VIAPSFADIFRNNCAKIGLLCVELSAEACKALIELAVADPQAQVRIDLPEQTVETARGLERFAVDPHTKHMLVEGLDPIGLTLDHEADIAAFEARRPGWLPTTVAR
jgi:3-isopropylmalate/(R)-2-methylmalate dehydratase small subunit